jgi:glutamate/tyrosine decarboxylase-like PLP-dependent enzyme
VVDPVAQVAAHAAARGVRCHVDACFGGWVLPYLRRLGEEVPAFDFSVPGVTSVSVDLHKYAYCPKGVSVLLHRDEELRMPQYFGYAGWPGYTMVNPVVSSTRSGGPIAAAWATLRHIGDAGYLALAARTRDAVRALSSAVLAADGLQLLPADRSAATTVVTFTADDPELDVFVVADELAARGWHTQPQFHLDEIPRSIHLTVTAAVASTAGDFGAALAESVTAARAAGPATVPEVQLSDVAALAAALGFGGSGGVLPERMAPVNALLDAAPPAVRERLLVAFLSLLQRPSW